MPFVAFPRLSSTPRSAQVFIGDFAVTSARTPRFLLDGNAVAPAVLRPMRSVRGPTAVAATTPRAFTGVYEFGNLPAGVMSTLRVTLGAESQLLPLNAPPDAIPSDAQGGFDIVLASCFCGDEYNRGNLRAGLATLLSEVRAKPRIGRRPDCTFLMGDQVYLDLPTLRNFGTTEQWLTAKFEHDYELNWRDRLAPVLALAPSVCLPDDHEFWNNAPHSSPFIQNSWTEAGRQTWRLAAQSLFDGFARPLPFAGGPGDSPFVLTIPPVSFFFADGRSGRQADRSATLTAACRAELARWVTQLNDGRLVGVFVTGQSLFRAPVSESGGKVADWELPNYGDYPAIVDELKRAELPLLSLTGDVHWGRVVAGFDRNNAKRIQEVVVSPLSLVTTIGADQFHGVTGALGGLIGKPDPWPRHSDPEKPPAEFGTGAGRYACQVVDGIKGDQLALLSFAFDPDSRRLTARVSYYAIHAQPPTRKVVPLVDLRIPN